MENLSFAHPSKYRSYSVPIIAVIVDDHPISADGMKSYLETDENIQVADICYDGEEALASIETYQPDIVIIDLELDGSRINGIDVAKQLRRCHPSLKLLVVSAYSNPERVLGAVGAGVDGYLIKTSFFEEILRTVYDVMGGMSIWDPRVRKVIQLYIGNNMEDFNRFAQEQNDAMPVSLTEREKDVIRLIALGYSNQEIAHELVIAEGTVKTHVSNMLEKLSLKDRNQASVWFHLNRHNFD